MPSTLIFDGQCARCLRLARILRSLAGGSRLRILSMDAPGAMDLHPNLEYAAALKAPQLILDNGYLCGGAEAGANALALNPLFRPLKYLYYAPLLRQAADLFYRLFFSRKSPCPSCP